MDNRFECHLECKPSQQPQIDEIKRENKHIKCISEEKVHNSRERQEKITNGLDTANMMDANVDITISQLDLEHRQIVTVVNEEDIGEN